MGKSVEFPLKPYVFSVKNHDLGGKNHYFKSRARPRLSTFHPVLLRLDFGRFCNRGTLDALRHPDTAANIYDLFITDS